LDNSSVRVIARAPARCWGIRCWPIQHNRTDASFDNVGVEFDAPVIEETVEPMPMMQAVADRFGDRRVARSARELLLEPGFERQHQRFALVPAHRTAPVSAVPTDGLLDRIERRDAFKGLVRDRRVAALGDIEKVPPQMAPADSERDPSPDAASAMVLYAA
jgi:hypothetical protein